MAATAISLQLRRNKTIAFRNPSFVQLFSSSSTSDPNVEDQNNASSSSSSSSPPPPPPPQSQSSFSSYFSDVKASLKQPSPQQRQLRKPFSPSPTPLSTEKPPSKVTSLLEIRKNLSEFRLRSTVPPPPASQQISFQELFERNVISKGEESSAKISFDSIRESIKQMQSKNTTNGGGRGNGSMSLSHYRESLKLRPMDPNQRESPMVIGGTNNLPASVFGKEIRDKSVEPSNMKTEFVKMYGYDELGSKLKRLRPEAKGDKWFSLGELNDRLMKLRELEEKEYESRIAGITFKDLRESLVKLKTSDDEKTRKSVIQRLDVLTQIGGTPTFMLAPPKENLVEKYFHPDNMSSSEKMKLELKKVRDEFKMSESDCGSARVQVAQLTTKIKHLSTALHKKDKHSRKGLQAMVQKRKKLLKYLRRTDWDSYCLVLSKLGLRDNPDYKN